MKKYSKIVRHGKKGTHLTIEGNPQVVIMEKLDGANASFAAENGNLKCFSRNTELDEENTLRGFVGWANSMVDPDDLNENYIYFGEWLVRHKLDYGDNEKNFYLFDIYDTKNKRYLDFEIVEEEAVILNLNLAPVFYKGEFQSLDHVNSFVGKSKLGEVGEGVVLKNYSYEDKHGTQVFTKIVSDEFAEKAKTKKQKLPQQSNELDDFVNTYLTKARVEKMISKLVDEGTLEEDYDVTDMGVILKNSAGRIAEDVIEEELDSLVKLVKKKIGKKYPSMVKEIVQ